MLVTLTQGTLSGSGALNANGGMLINPGGNSAGGYFFIDGRTINNAINHARSGADRAATFRCRTALCFITSGSFDAAGDGMLVDAGVGAPSSFVNEGIFSKLNSFSPVQIECDV